MCVFLCVYICMVRVRIRLRQCMMMIITHVSSQGLEEYW